MKAAAVLLREEGERLKAALLELVAGLEVEYQGDFNAGPLLIPAPEYSWMEPDQGARRRQLKLREGFLNWHERLCLLFTSSPPDLLAELDRGKEEVLEWLDLDTNWSLTPHAQDNQSKVRDAFEPLMRQLAIFSNTADEEILVIPDTNALTSQPDPRKYQGIAGKADFSFLLLATVLSQLDALKYQARDQKYREKVTRVIRRIKGWRQQGSLIAGVTVDRTIRVAARAQEPNFENTLGWLDRQNADDRIVASVLEVQRSFPTASVILVTGDINLQNKCDAAAIPWSDLPV